jgi:RNA ligase
MEIQRYKYPRSYHLPWSEGATSDDKTLTSVSHFVGQDVVVSEKCDGENTSIYPDGYMHARSLDSRSHESQAWVRALAGRIARDIPSTMRVCGENVFAKHSIGYESLSSYFYAFGMFEGGMSLSWDEVVAYSEMLDLQTVPVLYRGLWNEAAVKACYTGTSRFGGVQEGYVVRLARSFTIDEYPVALAKFVRAEHVQTGAAHWRSQAVVPNKLG